MKFARDAACTCRDTACRQHAHVLSTRPPAKAFAVCSCRRIQLSPHAHQDARRRNTRKNCTTGANTPSDAKSHPNQFLLHRVELIKLRTLHKVWKTCKFMGILLNTGHIVRLFPRKRRNTERFPSLEIAQQTLVIMPVLSHLLDVGALPMDETLPPCPYYMPPGKVSTISGRTGDAFLIPVDEKRGIRIGGRGKVAR